MYRRFLLVAAVVLSLSCRGSGLVPALPAPVELSATASAEYRVYAAILANVTKRLRASQLFVRDSAGAFSLAFSLVFSPSDGPSVSLSVDSLSAPVPIVLLGDSIEGTRDWRPIYRGTRHASGVLRLYRPAFNADTSTATTWLQNRCGPALCGGIEQIQLERRIDGAWTIVASHFVVYY